MSRDHFKKVMFTPNFVKDSRDELGQYDDEHKIEEFFKKIWKVLKSARK